MTSISILPCSSLLFLVYYYLVFIVSLPCFSYYCLFFIVLNSVNLEMHHRQLLVHGGNVEFKQGIAVGELILDPGSKLKGNVTSRSMRVQGYY